MTTERTKIGKFVEWFCYYSECSGRTKERPSPTSNGTKKPKKLISRKGNEYIRNVYFCNHCGKEMTATMSMDYGY